MFRAYSLIVTQIYAITAFGGKRSDWKIVHSIMFVI